MVIIDIMLREDLESGTIEKAELWKYHARLVPFP